jgi:DNA-binding transcriptional MerR regulator
MVRRPCRGLIVVVIVLVVGAWSSSNAAAQGAGQAKPEADHSQMAMDRRGGITGTVRSPQGAAAASGLTVVATNAENGARFTATTDAKGTFSFPALPVGKYDLSIETAGLTVFRQAGISVAENQTAKADLSPGTAAGGQLTDAERQELARRIAELEQRIEELETSTVLSEPETRVRQKEVYVDQDGVEHDQPVPGATKKTTYERERVYRRQTINEKIEAALEDAEKHSVQIGVDAAIVAQAASQTEGTDGLADNRGYALASADLFFTAGIAQHTIFFMDIVGLSGSPPDAEINPLMLLNGYTARLVGQNELNLREMWIRTELFAQHLALTGGRLDLTNYFDQNAFANDESTQFLGDGLVNNQMLGLAVNGTGVALEYDAKTGLRLKFGLQQSDNDAPNLTESIFTLSEVGYTFTPLGLPEGTYRLWFRTDNSRDESGLLKATGISIDQKLTPAVGVFARYGTQQIGLAGGWDDRYYSAGVSFQNGVVFNPMDAWGVGYAEVDFDSGDNERLLEFYYNFLLTEKLRLSFHLQSMLNRPGEGDKFGYLLPGVRFQAAF